MENDAGRQEEAGRQAGRAAVLASPRAEGLEVIHAPFMTSVVVILCIQ